MRFRYNDGGRAKYFKGKNAGDCVTRAIAIATGKDYKDVYNAMAEGMAKLGKRKSARNGVSKKVYHQYLLANGFTWIAKTKIGEGCTTHLHKDELPQNDIIIARLSRHLCCIVNGVINDVFDPRRGGNGNIPETRCVYGYYVRETEDD